MQAPEPRTAQPGTQDGGASLVSPPAPPPLTSPFLSYRTGRHSGAKPPLRVAERWAEPFAAPPPGEGGGDKSEGVAGAPACARSGCWTCCCSCRPRAILSPFPPFSRWFRPVRAIATAGALREDGGSGLYTAAGSVSAALASFSFPLLAPAPRPSRLPSASSPSPPGA